MGIREDTIKKAVSLMKVLNGRRPAAHRKTENEQVEKLLELIFTASKHFSQTALVEYNAAPADWKFQRPGPGNGPPVRDLHACMDHYHVLWSQAVKSKLAGFAPRGPVKKAATPARHTVEEGLAALQGLNPHEQAGVPHTDRRPA